MANIRDFRIFLDPGHNGTWTGAYGNGLAEHEVVLDIAKSCKSRLEAYGATVGMSRTTHNALVASDKNLDLSKRVELSNAFNADIFVSIHNNSADSVSANGVETYTRVGGSTLVKNLAADVNSLVVSRTGMSARNPAVKEADYVVIKSGNNAWSILVEVGFISNTSDATKLGKLSVRTDAGNAIADSIKRFVDSLPESS